MIARSVVIDGGLCTKVTSVCHSFAFEDIESTSRMLIVGSPGTVGCEVVIAPKRPANRSWPSAVRPGASKTSALCSTRPARSSSSWLAEKSAVTSIPETRAPRLALSLVKEMLMGDGSLSVIAYLYRFTRL